MSTEQQLTPRRGWGVEIIRKDGSSFLSCSSHGVLPAIWTHSQRRFAVICKRELIAEGFKARVVPVTFTDPVIVEQAQ